MHNALPWKGHALRSGYREQVPGKKSTTTRDQVASSAPPSHILVLHRRRTGRRPCLRISLRRPSFGQSRAARSHASIIRVDPETADLKIAAYEAIWNTATPL